MKLSFTNSICIYQRNEGWKISEKRTSLINLVTDLAYNEGIYYVICEFVNLTSDFIKIQYAPII